MIQIDMKMPEHCVDCPFSLDNCCLVLGKYISLKQWAKGGIQKWCPLKEQELVQCKDCKHMREVNWNDEPMEICLKHTFTGERHDDWFCADGEKLTD